MYRKTEREFQYAPGIEKVIEDVVGGGTLIVRDWQMPVQWEGFG